MSTNHNQTPESDIAAAIRAGTEALEALEKASKEHEEYMKQHPPIPEDPLVRGRMDELRRLRSENGT